MERIEWISSGFYFISASVWKEKCWAMWKLASLRLIKKMRGARVRKQGVIICVHTL